MKAISVYEDSDSSNALPNETSLDSSSVDDNSQWLVPFVAAILYSWETIFMGNSWIDFV